MLKVTIDQGDGIAVLEPDGALTESDFASATRIIDPYLEEEGRLHGIIIRTRSFPGWESFSALSTHLKFIKDHHEKISHLAFVTDSPLANVAEKISSHFIQAEIKNFDYDAFDDARDWIVLHHTEETETQ